MKLTFALTLFAIAVGAVFSCATLKQPEPKQRDDWTDPPTKYGDTQFGGLSAPGKTHGLDGGAIDEP
jgi:hypothetical protein